MAEIFICYGTDFQDRPQPHDTNPSRAERDENKIQLLPNSHSLSAIGVTDYDCNNIAGVVGWAACQMTKLFSLPNKDGYVETGKTPDNESSLTRINSNSIHEFKPSSDGSSVRSSLHSTPRITLST